MNKRLRTPLILASASPRRHLLLTQAGYEFRAIAPNIDEERHLYEAIGPEEYTMVVAREKAEVIAAAHPEALVIGSDTIVYASGQIIGKAADDGHARQIIRLLFGSPHDVITGIAVLKKDEGVAIIESVTTRVYPRMLSEEQIEEHIQKGDWIGKAGAYGIQETGDEFVERIEGSFTNVMGFPMERICEILAGFEV